MTKQRSFHHGNLRQALLDSATELLDTKGVAGTTLRAVAARAGVSHAAPVNHFKDLGALLTCVATVEFTRLWESIHKCLSAPDLTGADRIMAFSKAIAHYAILNPNRYDLLWRNDLVDHQDPELLLVMDRIYNCLCDEIRETVLNQEFDIDTFAVSIWSSIHGYVSLRFSGMFLERADEVRHEPRFDAMISLIIKAMRG
jgi:AcrR family transcriptional regulator